ncbi:MAG: hypothetical protein IT200_01680 [Thermoleophilia bacterium]|nr:hypothetical protein [Thermoleophilia bacterium]
MSDAAPAGAHEEGGLEQFSHIDGLVDALRGISDKRDERTLIFAKGENTRHLRHAQVLNRWPLLAEPWARAVEEKRVNSVDRTPGAASFGR